MPDVKRSYHAPVREEQSRLTRARILDAAAETFSRTGWAGTTVAGIASVAGVSPQAVHQSVGAKPALLVEAVRRAVAGNDESVPLREREPFRTAYDESQPVRSRAEAFAAGTREVYARAGALFLVLAQAAPLDQALAGLWDRARRDRLADCRLLVRTTGHRDRAAHRLGDQVFVLSGPAVHAELTALGWSARAYEGWLSDGLEELLG
jgi:AcrR family transcriptional regulator